MDGFPEAGQKEEEESVDHDNKVEDGITDDSDAVKDVVGNIFNKIKKAVGREPAAVPCDEEDYYAANEYNFSHECRGLAVVINNEKFMAQAELGDRPGSYYDARDLEIMFKHLGFKVKRYSNLTADEIVRKLKKIAANLKFDHSKADCFACAILSHGSDWIIQPEKQPYNISTCLDVVFGVDGEVVPTRYLVSLFKDSTCPELEGKPKLFFIQACRGQQFDEGQDIIIIKDPKDSTDAADKEPDSADAKGCGDLTPGLEKDTTDAGPFREIQVSPPPLFRDFLVMYASPPGYFAWRRTTGAWFIQSLKHVFMEEYNQSMSLIQALTRVSRRVAVEYESYNEKHPSRHGKKQVPCIMSMLTKDIYFRPKI